MLTNGMQSYVSHAYVYIYIDTLGSLGACVPLLNIAII